MDKRESRIFLIDAHEGARRALARLVNAESGLSVCGEASSLEEALRSLPGSEADAAVVNFDQIDGGGPAALGRLRWGQPGLPILAVSMRGPVHRRGLLQAGAIGCVVQSEAAREIIPALRLVLKGGVYREQAPRRPKRRR